MAAASRSIRTRNSRQIGARGDPDHAPFGRQVQRQGLCDLGRPARRRRQRGQRAVVRYRDRGRAQPELFRQTLFARPSDLGPLENIGAAPQPARHQRRLHPRYRDFRTNAVQAGAALQARPLQGLSLRRRRDTLALRSVADRRRHSPEAVFQFPGGLADHLPSRSAARMRDRRLLHRQAGFRRRPGIGRMGGRLAALVGRLVQLLLQHHPDPRRRHARAGPARGAGQGHSRFRRPGRPEEGQGHHRRRRR
jgi:hypothetical protein